MRPQRRPQTRWAKGTYMKLRSGATLRALMDQNGKSLRDVGRSAERHFTFIGQLVREERTTCKPEVAVRIARLLNVPLEVLFEPQASPSGERTVRPQTPKHHQIAQGVAA